MLSPAAVPIPAEICGFFGPYRYLSNFWITSVNYGGYTYCSVEHAYQSLKTIDPAERRRVLFSKEELWRDERLQIIERSTTPGEAKRAGKRVTLRPEWNDEFAIALMTDLVRAKFLDNQELARRLLSTGDALLIESGTGDARWGLHASKGTNWLGQILMEVRAELRS